MKAIPVLAAFLIAISACACERNELFDEALAAYQNAQSPFGFRVTSVTDTSITLEWNIEDGYSTYRLYRDMTFDMPAATLLYEGAGTTYYDSPLSSDTAYYYKLCAIDDTGGENCSKTLEARTGILPGATMITSEIVGTTQITVIWDTATNAHYYDIYRDDVKVNASPITVTTYTDQGLTPGTTYNYQVQAANNYGYGPLSSYYTTSTQAGNIPGPTSITAALPSSAAVYLEWNVSSDATEYLLQRSTTSDFSAGVTPLTVSATNYTDSGLSSNTQYYYRVRGVNGFGNGTYSSVAPATTTPDTFTSIGHSLIQGQTGNLSTNDITASSIVPGDIFLYQTSAGYLGRFEVQGVQNYLVIRWFTFNIDGSGITSEGQGLIISLNDNCDLDSGIAGPSVTGDFYWGWDPLTFIPNGADGASFYEYYSAGP